ncbi:MAG: hypothetical protein HZC42_12015 [Candidatus Eisenbacteria bacterium]|nr:hypothetical protein [Candidatus Eisenbacteria bacterium]
MRIRACAALFFAACFLPFPARAWTPNGVALSRALYDETNPQIAPDGSGGAYVAWTDDRADPYRDIYLQHVTASGEIAPGWPANGLLICDARRAQFPESITPDDSGGVLMTWIDNRKDTGDIYIQRVTASGALAPGWPACGVPACAASGQQGASNVASDGAGGAFVGWTDFRGNTAAYLQHVLGSGVIAPGWPVDGRPLAPTSPYSNAAEVLADGSGGVFVGWTRFLDATATWAQAVLQHLTFSGEVAAGWPAEGVVLCTVPQGPGLTALVSDGAGGAYAVWDDWRRGATQADFDIYAQRVTASGVLAPGWPADGLPLCTASNTQWASVACPDGQGGLIAAWVDYRAVYYAAAYAIRVGPDGQRLPGWPENGLRVSTAYGFQSDLGLATDGQGGAYVSFTNLVDYYKVYAQHLGASGLPAPGWTAEGTPLASTPSEQQHPVIVPDGSGGAIVSWDDGRDDLTWYDIYAQKLVPDGPVPVNLSLASVEATPTAVTLRWFAGAGASLTATVYRRDSQTDWLRLGTVSADGTGNLVFADRTVAAGTRYAYRLGIGAGTSEAFTAETWVEVPAGYRLALAGLRPNPATGPLQVSFSLPDGSPAMLELLDVAGRRIAAREVGSLGPGQHLMRLEEQVPVGLYWLRLRRGGRSLTARAAVTR